MKPVFSFVILLFVLQACKNNPDFEKEKQAILILHENQRKAHFEKNIPLLLGDSTSNFVEINRGMVKRLSREESTKRFQSYFDAVDFIKWDDVTTPVFQFSDDATMATTVVEKLVVTKLKSEANRFDTVNYAWLAVYRKINGKWRMEQIASTNR